jgi:hypothetical protein
MYEADFYAPHISDPDDPNEYFMTTEQCSQAAKRAALLHPELWIIPWIAEPTHDVGRNRPLKSSLAMGSVVLSLYPL